MLLETIYSVPGVKGHNSIVKKKRSIYQYKYTYYYTVRLGGVEDLCDKDVGVNDKGLY